MKNRRFVSMLLVILMVMSMFASIPFSASAAASTVTASDWKGLQNAINKASSGQTIQLGADITCEKNKGDQIKVDGKTVTLDLNGHKLNRNRTKSDGDGHVIEVKGKSTLTIIDSKGGGTITGGYATRGGGINVAKGSTCNLKGGTVTGNKAKYGGGVYAHGTFKMEGGAISSNTVTDCGGGIYCNSTGTLTLTGGSITKNKANDDGNGGGIFNSGSSSVTLKNVTISDNYSDDDGGAIENADKGKITLTACTLSGNTTDDEGGGVFNGSGCTLTVERCTISGNTANDEGGAIFNKGPLTVTGGVIKDNTAKGGHGGGIRLWSNTATITRVEVSGNESKNGDGGAIYVGGATLNVVGGIYSKNTSRDDGGAIYTEGNTTVKGNVVFEDNYSFNSGGALRIGGKTTTIEAGTFKNNEAGDSGGAIYVNDGTLKLYGGSITENSTMNHDGGGIMLAKKGTVKVHGAPVVKDNKAGQNGPDIYVRGDAKIELDAALKSGAELGVDAEKHDKAFTKNFNKQNKNEVADKYFKTLDGWTILTRDGEAVVHQSNWPQLQAQIDAAPNWGTVVLDRDYKACEDDAPLFIKEEIKVYNVWNTRALTIDLNGHTIDRALTKPTAGGAVIMNRGNLTIKDSKGGGKITGGWADDDGGGIWSPGQLTLENVRITGNHAVNDGGGVHCTYRLYIRGGEISNNTAGGLGGGVYNEHDLEISDAEIKNNTAGKSGGGLVIGDLAEATITSGTITGNTAKYYGGGIYLDKFRAETRYTPALNLKGGTITGNKAGLEGGGILYTNKTIVRVKDAPVVDGNTAPAGANMLLRAGTVLEVAGKLADGAKLDVTAQDTTKVLTKGLEASGSDLAVFTYNQNQGVAPSLLDGELYVNLDVKADVWVSDWDGLQKAVKNAKNGQIIALSKNLYGKGKSRIKVDDGKKITLELNGYTLDRQRTSSDSDGHVIEVKGKSTLTITDAIGTGTITGGYATRGGGINVAEGSTCILKGGTVVDNKAKLGGGVYAHGTFKMEGGSIAGNEATGTESAFLKDRMIMKSVATGSGGGIYCGEEGALNLTGGTISGNTSDDAGGIYNGGSKNVTIKGVKIIGNTSRAGGGGVNNNDGGTAKLENCEIRGNHADGNGGGIWNQEDSTVTLENCVIESNTSDDQGGGIFSKGPLTVTGGAIKDNTAKGKGGGIRLWHDKATINSGEITGNTSKDQGGGIYVGGATLNLYGGSITGNKASEEGGGVYFEENKNAHVNVHGAPVVADNADESNIYLNDGRVLTLDGAMTKGAKLSVSLHGLEYGGNDWYDGEDISGHNGVITKNFKKYNGNEDPGDYFTTDIETFSVKLRNDEVLVIESDWYDLQRQIDAAENGATIVLEREWFGCDKDDALNIPSGKTLTIDLNGHALNRGLQKATVGGAVIMNFGTLTIKDSRGRGKITGGWADDHAGGIWNQGTLTLEGGTITGNKCTNDGGGVYNNGTLIVKGGTISNNNSGRNGGGVYSVGELTISGGEFKGNTAAHSGGALNIAGKTATITGGAFTGNVATRYHGGAIYLANATLNLYGGAITENKATMEGGAILYGTNSTLNVQGEPIVKDNTAPTGANILIRKGRVIGVTGQLAESAKLDVTAQGTDSVLTQGLEASGSSVDRFTYAAGSVQPSTMDGELYVNFDVKADLWASDWKGLQDAVKKAQSGQTIALSKDVSADGKDRIKVEGGKSITLDLNGYTMNRGRTKKGGDGHVIEVTGKSTLTIKDTRGTGVIKGGWATRGGGINVAKDSTCILEGGTVTDNKAEYGGGVYAHGTFKMKGGAISGNSASDTAGGVYCNSNGSLELTGGSITDNTGDDCGGVYNSGSKSVKLKNVTIANNTSKQGGGGFNNNDGGSATLENCTIRGNHAATGGGLWNQKNATLTLTNCAVTDNKADSEGGGVYARGTLTISGGSFTGNTANTIGGCLNVTGDAKAVNISGSLVMKGNSAPRGNNVYVDKKTLTVSGAMTDGAEVGVYLESDTGVFAKKFGTANPDEDPAKYFFSENGWDLGVISGDAALIEADRLEDNSSAFIHGNSRIVSYENVNSRNWMSGISGERTLNEINIPGTHDAAMADPVSAKSLWEDTGSLFNGYKDAQTQIRYIDEQMNDGYRYFDLRLNNKYQKRHNAFYEFHTIDYRDDGKNLWLCHGCNAKGGTYYAKNHNGDPTSLDEVLDWAKTFLKKNPSEVIILSLRPETQWEDQYDTIYLRAKKIFYKFSREINPSTGKPYLYMEDGVFGKNYSDYPKLKDVRGQVIMRVNHDRDNHGKANLGGLASFGMGGKKAVRPDGGFEETPDIIIQHINSFYNRYGGVEMPRDALTHLNLLYYVPTNIVEKEYYPIVHNVPIRTPIESAADVNPVLFGEGGTFDQTGYYLGWVCMIDRATSYEAARVWRTNFYDMDYVTVTVKSGLSKADLASGQYTETEGTTDGLSEQDETAAAQASGQAQETAETEEGTQTYLLLRGTEITIPQCVYEYDSAETGRDFQSWNAMSTAENRTVLPGETFVVMEDTTFTGQWLAQGETSVDVKWQDMNDLEGLRADSLELQVWPDEDPEHVYTATVAAADGWRAVLEGDVQKIVPVWERVDANAEDGADTVDGYRYELADAADLMQLGEETEVALAGSGLILTMIHTPQETVAATGTVEWDDYDNRDGLRPESATLHLMQGEEELASQTVTAENGWQYDFGEYPAYEDGQRIVYSLAQDEIEGYNTSTEGMAITNAHAPKVVAVSGAVFWDDARNEKGERPESVTVRLLANGEEVASLEVTPEGASATLLEVFADYEKGASEESAPVDEDAEYNEEEEETDETDKAEADEATEPAETPVEEASEEEAADDSAYVDRGDDAEEAEAESGETPETEETEEAGWNFSFYGVPVYDGGREVAYTIVEDEIEKYDYTINTAEEIWITNILLPDMVTVAFDANGGEGEMDKVEIAPQSEYALPESGFTAPEGMAFAGWTVVVEAPKVEETESETEGEAEAEAEAEPVEEVNEEATEAEAEPAEPTIYSAGDAISVSGNATIIAQWLPIPPIYTVTFDGNGGEGAMEAAEANEEGEYTLPESGFTAPEGMEFAGWKVTVEEAQLADEPAVEVEAETAENAEEAEAAEASEEPAEFAEYTYAPGDTITLTGNATAIAQWQAPAKPITITFDANGGEGEMEAAEPGEDGSYALPENGFTAPEGAEFIGWRIATEATQAEGIETETEAEAADESERVFSAGDVIVVSADTTVIAQWQLPESEEADEGEEISVTVTLKVVNGTWGDGTRDDKTIVLTGHAGEDLWVSTDDIPGAGYNPDEGYDMGSWDTEPPTYLEEYDMPLGDPITEDTTYTYTYAVKEDAEVPMWTILFDANGGEGEMENATVEDRDPYALPECGYTAPEGMEFAGWLVSDYLLDPGEILIVNEDIPVTAQWREIGAAPTEEQPTEDQPEVGTEEGTEEQPSEAGTEEQPVEGGTEEQPTEAGTEEQPEEGTEGQIEAGTEEQPVEGGTEEQPEEQPEEGTEEQPEEQPVEGGTEEQPEEGTEEQSTDEQPAEGLEVEYGDEPVEEPGEETTEDTGDEVAEGLTADTEDGTEEQPTEAGTEEQPEEQPTEEQPGEPTEEQSVEAPADAQMRTITFDGGGADGEMAAVQVAEGSEYTLPECEYSIEGCVFSAWTVSANGAEPATYQAGETITVTGDMTAVAGWAFDEGEAAVEPGEGEIEYGEGESTEETAGGDESGLEVETEDAPEETPVDEGLEAEGPSEAGSVFSGAGIAAIVAAAALALGAGGVAVARKKKRK